MIITELCLNTILFLESHLKFFGVGLYEINLYLLLYMVKPYTEINRCKFDLGPHIS